MKKITTCLLLLVSLFAKAQQPVTFEQSFSFEFNNYQPYFLFDTASQNLWQVGIPQKTVFNASQSSPSALVTSLTNTYPVNNVSRFQLMSVIQNLPSYGHFLNFSYKINSDTSLDGGLVEISHDHGNTWINIISDPAVISMSNWYNVNDTIASFNKPGFSGTTNSWIFVQTQVGFTTTPDTVLFRFTFKSDGINTNKDGWMIDDLAFGPYFEGIQEYSDNNLISVSPNPAVNEINFRSEKKFNKAFEISIYNSIGQKVQDEKNTIGKIDVSQLKPGIYFVNFKNDDFYASKKIAIQKQ